MNRLGSETMCTEEIFPMDAAGCVSVYCYRYSLFLFKWPLLCGRHRIGGVPEWTFVIFGMKLLQFLILSISVYLWDLIGNQKQVEEGHH